MRPSSTASPPPLGRTTAGARLRTAALLGRNLAKPAHVFWPDDLPLVDGIGPTDRRLQGHGQLTDRYLLALASHHDGVLASFDGGIQQFVAKGGSSPLELVPSGS